MLDNATQCHPRRQHGDQHGTVGCKLSNTSPAITNNIVRDNGTYPFYQAGNAFPTYSGNTVTGNGVQAIAVGGTVGTGAWVNVQGLGLPYVVVGSVTVPQGATLTLPAGTVVKFGAFLPESGSVRGLVTQGTAANPVVFTSDRDNTVGGPPTGSGTPAAGNWGCLSFANANGTYQMEYAVVRYGGYATGCNGMIQSTGSLTLRHMTIEKAYGTAIYTTGSQTTVADSVIATVAGLRSSIAGLRRRSCRTTP